MLRDYLAMGAVVAFVILSFGHNQVWAVSSASPGKFTAATSVSGISLDPQVVTTTTVELAKGKSKRILMVDGQVQVMFLASSYVSIEATVNGVALEPTPGPNYFHVATDTGNPASMMAFHFWIDLDAAEAAAPGTIKGQPLTIAVTHVVLTKPSNSECTFAGICPGAHLKVSLSAQQVKK